MADARYIIDIILKARDDTAAAMASATANMRAFQAVADDNERKSRAFARSVDDMSREVSTSTSKLGALTRAMNEHRGATADTVDQQVQLELATRRYVRTLGDENATLAQRAQALQRVQEAQRSLTKALDEAHRNDREWSRERSVALTREITDTQSQIAQAERLRQIQAEATRAQQREEAERIRLARQRARVEQDTARATANTVRALEAEQLRTRRENMRRLADLDRADQREREKRRRQEVAWEREDEARRQREIQAPRDYLDALRQIQRLEESRRRAKEHGDVVEVARLDFDDRQAHAKAEALAAELRLMFRNIEANVDLDTGALTAHAAEVMAIKEMLGRDIHFDVKADLDASSVARTLTGMELLKGAVSETARGFDEASTRISTFDNFLRGLAAVGIFFFFNQLILLALAAAGALTGLASSAAMAGGAIGGGLIAGIAQALPMIGLVATALYRLKAVFDATNQAQLLQQQQSYQQPRQNKRIADSLDQVRAAQQRLADAHRRVRDAQQGVIDAQENEKRRLDELNTAREEARRKLYDLILAERGARLSMEESNDAIRNATSSADLTRLFFTRDQARADLGRTSTELTTRRRLGIERSPEVVDAKRALQQAAEGIQKARQQLADAKRAVDDAEIGIARARRGADIATANITAAAGKLDFLLSRLSPAERRLYQTMMRIQDVFRETAQVVVEPLIDATDRGMRRIIDIIEDPAITSAMRSLSSSMADAGNQVFDAFTSREALDQLLRISAQAQQNLQPLADIAINIGRSFADLAEAAGPALNEIFRWIADITAEVSDFLSMGLRTGSLQNFFREGVVHLRAWAGLMWQIVRLFAAITGAGGGAQAGLNSLTGVTRIIRGWADSINDADSRANRFFRRFFDLSERMLAALGPVLVAIAREIDKTFNRGGLEAVQGFAFFLAEVVIPGIGRFIRFMGTATRVFTDFLRAIPGGTQAFAALISVALTASVLMRAASLFTPLFAVFKFLFGAGPRLRPLQGVMAGLAGAAASLAMALSRLPGPVGRLFGAMGGRLGAGAAGAAAGTTLLDLPGVGVRGAAGGADDVARSGGRFGRLFGAGFRTAAFGVLKKAGWIGVGIAAVDGLMSAFRYRSVRAGIQDFAHSLSFGLVDSFEEMTKKNIDRALGEINDRVSRARWNGRDLADINPLRLGREFGVRRPQGGARSAAGSFGFQRVDTPFQRLIDEIRKVDPYFARLLAGTARYDRAIRGIARTIGRAYGNMPYDNLRELDRYIVSITTALERTPRTRAWDGIRDSLIAIREEAEKTRRKLLEELAPRRLAFNFGLALQNERVRVRDATRALIREIRRLPPGARREAAAAAIQMAEGLESRGAITRGAAKRIRDDVVAAMRDMRRESARRAAGAASDVATALTALSNVTAVSMRDMVTGVNSVLESFGISGIKMPRQISPRDVTQGIRTVGALAGMFGIGRAGGGFVGSAGERGRDLVPTVLGRGEAVLNWAHQKLVEPAMRAYYGIGLGDMFRRTSAFHAGGPGTAPGFAEGGYTGPAGSGEGFMPIANFAKQKFNLTMTAGRTNHSYLTSSGNVSDHSKGLAGDFSNGFAPTPQMDGFNAFWKTRLPQTVKQLIWRGKDQFGGFPISDHFNHVHLAVQPAFAFSAALMARLLSRASRGLSITRLLGNLNTDTAEGADVDHIHRTLIKGKGPLIKLAQRIVDRARRAANRFIDRKAPTNLGNIKAGPNDIDLLPKGQGITVGASEFGGPGDPGTGTTGYRGDNLAIHPDSYAELSQSPGALDFSALGGLPYMTALRITGSRGSAVAYKRDVGAGGGAVGQFARAIDLWYTLADKIGVSGLAPVKIQRLAQGGFAGIQQFARGGSVRGNEGAPVPIIAHAGEWVLNKLQQSRLAGLMGLSTGRLKGFLGFDGGPAREHFADGGEVMSRPVMAHVASEGTKSIDRNTKAVEANTRATKEQVEQRKREREARARTAYNEATRYGGPDLNIAPTSVGGITREISAVFRAIGAIGRGRIGSRTDFDDRISRFSRNLNWLLGDNGYLTRLSEAIGDLGTRMALTLDLARVGYQRVGSRLRRVSPLTDAIRTANETIDQLERIGALLVRERRTTVRALGQTDRRVSAYLRRTQSDNRSELRTLLRDRDPSREQRDRINELRRLLRGRRIEDRLTQRQRDAYQRLVVARNELRRFLDSIDQDLVDNATARFQATADRFSATTENRTRRYSRSRSDLERSSQLADIRGDTFSANFGAGFTLLPMIEEQRVLRSRLAEARRRARRNPAMRAVIDDLEQRIGDLDIQIAQRIHDNLSNMIDSVNAQYDDRSNSIDLQRRVASAFGREGALAGLAQQQIQTWNEQIAHLQQILPSLANDPGLYKRVQQQIAELSTSVQEATAQMLSDAIDAVDREAQRRETALGLQDRISNVRERAGDQLGAIRARMGTSDQRLAGLRSDQLRYQALLAQAMLQGNEAAIKDLTERLGELDVTIQEETQASRELIFTYRQTATDIITGQQNRATGLLGGVSDLLTKLGNVTGIENVQALMDVLQKVADVLRTEAIQLVSDVSAAIGGGEFGAEGGGLLAQLLSAFQQGPEAFALKLAELAPLIAALEATMGDSERGAFGALIDAMLSNATATVDNTDQLRQLNGSSRDPQTWSSTAWQWYREAIFNGMGSVLPQYDYPAMATGGWVTREGLMRLHPGEFVVNARADNLPVKDGDVNVTINEAGERVDLQHLASRIAFAKKNRI